MAAISGGFSSNGNGNNNNIDDMMITNHDGKEESLHMFDRRPLHLDPSHLNRRGRDERNQQAHERPTRESVLKRLYDALMRRSLTKVCQPVQLCFVFLAAGGHSLDVMLLVLHFSGICVPLCGMLFVSSLECVLLCLCSFSCHVALVRTIQAVDEPHSHVLIATRL